MVRTIVAVPLAMPLVLACLSCTAPAPPLGSAQADEMVTRHNERRAAALPAPTPALAPLAHDDALAATASAWASRCVFEHSSGNGLGENLAFFSGDASTPSDVVAAWADEDAFYDYESNACDADQQCGHYTQVVWRGTERMGCGAATCTIDGFEGLFWVCNYDPPGNFVGERPY